MAVFDGFDRGTLGANWESPAFPASRGDGPLAMISGLDGVEMTPVDVNNDYCSGIYIDQSFDYNRQYSEIEIIEEITLANYTSWYADYASYDCLLCAPLAAGGDLRGAIFRFTPHLSYTSYEPIYLQMTIWDDAGVAVQQIWSYLPIANFFTADRVPVGTRLRFERKGNTFTGYLYSPDTLLWYEVMSLEDATLPDGYPGLRIYATDSADDARASNFRAGTTGDPFIDLAAKVPGQIDAPGQRNKRQSRYISGQNDVSYRLGIENGPAVGTYDNKNRNRFS